MEPAHAAANPAAGWFADPHLPNLLRWWDGIQWTHHTHPAQAPAAQQSQAHLAPAHAAANTYGQGAPAHAAATNGYGQAATASTDGHGAAANIYGQAAPAHAAAGAGYGISMAVSQAVPAGVHASSYGSSNATATAALPSTTSSESLFDANQRSFLAIGVSILYLVLAITAGIVMAGIVPALATFRAFERREKLAPVAAVAAAIAIGFAITHWQTR